MEMPKDLTILDLVILEKIEKDSVMESFSGKLYSSFFDTASMLGTLQVKHLVQINSSIGRSMVNKSELGDQVLLFANEKSTEPLEGLDHVILKSIASGHKGFDQIKNDLNLRSDDLSIHLYRLIKQGYSDYEIRNGKLALNITEKGFKLTGYVPKPQPVPAQAVQKVPPRQVGVPESKQLKQLDLKSVLSHSDATPFGEEGKTLGALDKMTAKLIFYMTNYAPVFAVGVLVLAFLVLYLLGYIRF